MQTPVAAEAGLERQHAGQAGVQQVHALLRTCKGIIDACQAMQPAAVKPEAGPGPSSSAEVTEKLASLQREYASTLGAIRATMQQCRELEQQDQQASAAGGWRRGLPVAGAAQAAQRRVLLPSRTARMLPAPHGLAPCLQATRHLAAAQAAAVAVLAQTRRPSSKLDAWPSGGAAAAGIRAPHASPGPCAAARLAPVATQRTALLRWQAAGVGWVLLARRRPLAPGRSGDDRARDGGRGHPPPYLAARSLVHPPRRQRLEDTNQLVKQMIDRLRLLLDALNMWDAHQTQLAQASAAQQ